ncbi:MAG TPA: AbrB/MazE/SpoVT family DNA-binding domain-containing protein [Chloroflexia bacterium]|nr:AbrB/MazE/SpoVT family DNA-binding domain-containing protein [Chloroflexia bacterium]
MSQTIRKWGNSLAVRIPKAFVEQLHWDADTEVVCTVVAGKLVVEPAATPGYDLDQLLAGITAENLPEEIDMGPAVGNELW